MINETNIEKAKLEIKKSVKPAVVLAKDDNFNRKIAEYGGFDMILGLDSLSRRRSLRNIDSGLNHVVARILEKNKIAIGIDLESIRCLSKKDKAERLLQIIQNLRIAKKNKVKVIAINYKDKINTMNLMRSLGADSQTALKSLDF